jgi:hypothetical protein
MTAPLMPRVARKTVTRIQEKSVYKERWTLPHELPAGSTARQEFLDSAGALIAEVVGTISGRYILFEVPYVEVEQVPNGAGFYCFVHIDGEDPGDEHMAFYGSVFRRQLTFPHSPARSAATVVRKLRDDFQRPAGSLGGKWKTLVGRPRIFDNGSAANSVGPDYNFFSRYYTYYYQPFNSDTVDLAISAMDKGAGKTIVTICASATASSYLYLGWDSDDNTAELGFGTSPDIGSIISPSSALQPQITPVALNVPDSPNLGRYRLRYDDVTKELAFYNSDLTVKYASWVDEDDYVPHGRGYRYVGIGGNSSLFNSGVQVAFLEAIDAV